GRRGARPAPGGGGPARGPARPAAARAGAATPRGLDRIANAPAARPAPRGARRRAAGPRARPRLRARGVPRLRAPAGGRGPGRGVVRRGSNRALPPRRHGGTADPLPPLAAAADGPAPPPAPLRAAAP